MTIKCCISTFFIWSNYLSTSKFRFGLEEKYITEEKLISAGFIQLMIFLNQIILQKLSFQNFPVII